MTVGLADEASWDGVEVSGSFAGVVASLVDVNGCRLTGAVFTGTEIDKLRVVDTVVEDCEFSGAVLTRLSAVRVEFRRCRMSGVDVHGDLRRADFTKTQAAGVTLHGSELEGIVGAEGLQGVVIGGDQVIPLALTLFSALRIRIEDG